MRFCWARCYKVTMTTFYSTFQNVFREGLGSGVPQTGRHQHAMLGRGSPTRPPSGLFFILWKFFILFFSLLVAGQSTYPDGQSNKYNIFSFVIFLFFAFYNSDFVNNVPSTTLLLQCITAKFSNKEEKEHATIRKTFIIIINLIRIKKFWQYQRLIYVQY